PGNLIEAIPDLMDNVHGQRVLMALLAPWSEPETEGDVEMSKEGHPKFGQEDTLRTCLTVPEARTLCRGCVWGDREMVETVVKPKEGDDLSAVPEKTPMVKPGLLKKAADRRRREVLTPLLTPMLQHLADHANLCMTARPYGPALVAMLLNEASAQDNRPENLEAAFNAVVEELLKQVQKKIGRVPVAEKEAEAEAEEEGAMALASTVYEPALFGPLYKFFRTVTHPRYTTGPAPGDDRETHFHMQAVCTAVWSGLAHAKWFKMKAMCSGRGAFTTVSLANAGSQRLTHKIRVKLGQKKYMKHLGTDKGSELLRDVLSKKK
ncbi:hypothetical protein KIPB_008576, partial [Kipferlia bialata]